MPEAGRGFRRTRHVRLQLRQGRAPQRWARCSATQTH